MFNKTTDDVLRAGWLFYRNHEREYYNDFLLEKLKDILKSMVKEKPKEAMLKFYDFYNKDVPHSFKYDLWRLEYRSAIFKLLDIKEPARNSRCAQAFFCLDVYKDKASLGKAIKEMKTRMQEIEKEKEQIQHPAFSPALC